MSTTQISFNVKLAVGEQTVPLESEIMLGSAADGVQQGMLFRLALKPGDPPVTVNIGDIIGLVEEKLGAGTGALAGNSGLSQLAHVFGADTISPASFTAQNDELLVDIQEFTLNSTTDEFLFSISVDLEGSDPTAGLLALPPALASWLKIDNLAVSFSATTKRAAPR